MKRRTATRTLAGAVSLAMVSTPVLAEKADRLNDLVGVNAAGGQSALEQRGFSYAADAAAGSSSKAGYYWHARDKNCIRVETQNGRYVSITDASDGDCNQKSSGNSGAIVAGVIGAAVIGALLLSRKSKNNNDSGYQQDWQQVEVYGMNSGTMRIFANPSTSARVRGEVGPGTILRNYGCDNYGGESWCEVSTFDGRSQGWARDRFLRPTQGVGPYPPGNGWGGASELVEVYGVRSGMLKITAGPSKNEHVVGRVGNGTRLNRLRCETAGRESWCQVTTTDRQMYGWARDRYLRSLSGGGYYPPGGGGYYPEQYQDLIGARAAGGMDQLDGRGFRQVDNFTSGNARYSIRWRQASRQCLQVIVADGRIANITDIQTHPRCR